MTNLRAVRDKTLLDSQHRQRLPSSPLRLTAAEISQSPTQWVPGLLLYILSPTQWIPGRLLYTLSPTQGVLGRLLYILSPTQRVQAGCWACSVSYTVRTRATLPEGKVALVWIWPLISISCQTQEFVKQYLPSSTRLRDGILNCCLCILLLSMYLIVVYVFLLLSMYSYCSSMYFYCCLCILIVAYVFLDAATLTEVFPCFFLGCKANARV